MSGLLVERVVGFLIAPISSEEEDFLTFLRKCCITILHLIMPFVVLYTGYWIYWGFIEGIYGCVLAALGALVFWAPGYSLPYVVARKTKHVSSKMLLFAISCMNVGLLCVSLGIPEFPTRYLSIVSMFIAIMGQTPYLGPQILFTLLLQLLTIYNDTVLRDRHIAAVGGDGSNSNSSEGWSTLPLLVTPSHYEISFLEYVLNWAVCLVISWMGIAVVLFQVRTNIKQVAAAECAAHMSSELIPLLDQYRTEEVREMLSGLARTGTVDPELITSFGAINDNMERSRQLLPNFFFMKGDEGADDGMGRDSCSAHLSDFALSSVGYRQVESSSSLRGVSHKGLSLGGEGTAPTVGTPKAAARTAWGGGGGADGEEGSRLVASASSSNHPLAQSPSARSGRGVTAATTSTAVHLALSPTPQPPETTTFTGRISWASLDFRQLMQSCWNAPNAVAQISAFADVVYSNAAMLKGAIHSMVGDTAVVTWNATHRVAQPEAKAAMFLARMLAANPTTAGGAKGPSVAGQLAGVACSGHATMHSIVTSTTKQQTLVIHLPWAARVEGMMHLARRYQRCLIDDVTHSISSFTVVSRAVDRVYYRTVVPQPPGAPAQGSKSWMNNSGSSSFSLSRDRRGSVAKGGNSGQSLCCGFLCDGFLKKVRAAGGSVAVKTRGGLGDAGSGTSPKPGAAFSGGADSDDSASGRSVGGGGGGAGGPATTAVLPWGVESKMVLEVLHESQQHLNEGVEWMYTLALEDTDRQATEASISAVRAASAGDDVGALQILLAATAAPTTGGGGGATSSAGASPAGTRNAITFPGSLGVAASSSPLAATPSAAAPNGGGAGAGGSGSGGPHPFDSSILIHRLKAYCQLGI